MNNSDWDCIYVIILVITKSYDRVELLKLVINKIVSEGKQDGHNHVLN